ncbi:MAG: aspartate/glutamate racemase family protein, partial [Oscillospiraceae bacterium]|nr:aspartate/glutamate racemase family protein [Oscillospiraceae bacterium]
MDNRPIGVFDSGLGGLTAVRRLIEVLPHEDIIYLGDTSRVPYGSRSKDTIRKYAGQDAAFLKRFDIKALVVACGTVSTTALDTVREKCGDIPVFGVVDATARKAASVTRNGRIG